MQTKAFIALLCLGWLAGPTSGASAAPGGIAYDQEQGSDRLWQNVKDLFGAGEFEGDRFAVPGADVRVILSGIVPGLDQYMQLVVDNLDLLEIKREKGKVVVDVRLITKKLDFALREKKAADNGQVYKVRFYQYLHFEISMKKENVFIEKIDGLRISVKLPFLPDGVFPRGLFVNNQGKFLTLHAEAIGKLVDVVAGADMKAGEFSGIEWFKTLMMNLPKILGSLFFSLLI